MTKENEPPGSELNEAEFIAHAREIFEAQAAERQALVLSQIERPIDLRAYEDYLKIDNALLKKLDPYGELVFIDGVLEGIKKEYYLATTGKADEEFLIAHRVAGYEKEQDIIETIQDERLHNIEPIMHLMEKAALVDVRTLTVWVKYAKNEDSTGIATRAFLRMLAESFLHEGRSIPSRLRLLIPHTDMTELKMIAQALASSSHDTHSLRIAKEHAEYEAELKKAGTDPKLAKKLAEKRAPETDELLGKLAVATEPDKLHQRDLYLKTFKDPRELVDILLDVKDGKLGGKL